MSPEEWERRRKARDNAWNKRLAEADSIHFKDWEWSSYLSPKGHWVTKSTFRWDDELKRDVYFTWWPYKKGLGWDYCAARGLEPPKIPIHVSESVAYRNLKPLYNDVFFSAGGSEGSGIVSTPRKLGAGYPAPKGQPYYKRPRDLYDRIVFDGPWNQGTKDPTVEELALWTAGFFNSYQVRGRLWLEKSGKWFKFLKAEVLPNAQLKPGITFTEKDYWKKSTDWPNHLPTIDFSV